MFDLQAHRGGAGLAPENSLEAFANALDLGVSTLELDVQITADGQPVVHHDRTLPDGEFISWLPCSLLSLPTLDQVLELVEERDAKEVRLNIETKFDVLHPDEVAPRERFAEVVSATVVAAGFAGRASVQSFDWDVLDQVRSFDVGLRLNVLTNTSYLEVGADGASPWLAGVDIDDFEGDVVRAAAGRGYDALSPHHALVTPEFVAAAHATGLDVIPYTVDDPIGMAVVLDAGVDGLITNRPDLARDVLAGRGLDLPRRYPAAG